MSDTIHDNPARLRTYRVRLYWPRLERFSVTRINATDAWDANALIRLNYPDAKPFAFEAWNGEEHAKELRAHLDAEYAAMAAKNKALP